MTGPAAFGSALRGPFLVVDDSPTIIAVMSDHLVQLGVPESSIRTASSEEEAIQILQAYKPHIAFVDMDIGEGRGENVMREILKRDPLAKVVLTTGLGREDARVVAAVSHGAFAFLRKPLRREAVKQVLDDIDAESRSYDRIR